MSTRRVLIGKDNSGAVALKSTLPGFDVLTDNDQDSNKFSFNSAWTDIVAVHALGLVTLAASPTITAIPIPSISYIPFFEMRMYSGGNYYNDWACQLNSANDCALLGYTINNTPCTSLYGWASSSSPVKQVFYVVYKLGYNT